MSAEKPKELIYVWNYLEWGGAQVYFLGLAARLGGRVPVRFVFPEKTSPQFVGFCERLGIEYEFLDHHADSRPAETFGRKLGRHLAKFRTERATLRYLKKFDLRESILHIEFSPWQSMLALLLLSRRGTVFMTMHNALPPVPRWRYLLWKAKFAVLARRPRFHLFASNRDARESLRPLVRPDFFEKIRVTYTNVNPDEVEAARAAALDREALLGRFGIPADRFLVFGLGQFIDRKGRWTFLEAARTVAERDAEVCFVWITNSKVSAEDAERIESYGLGARFFLLESAAVAPDHDGLMRFLRLAGVFVLPSFVEGLPISLLEAMSLGVASISTNVYAIPEAVRDGETGLLVEPGDAGALGRAIERLRGDAELRERLGAAGREWVLANFNERTVAEIAWAAYLEAYGERG